MRTIDLIVRKSITFFFTFVVLGMSFAVVYGLSTVQVRNQDNRYISFLISLTIVIFNYLINSNFLKYFSFFGHFHRLWTQLDPHRLLMFLCSQVYICAISQHDSHPHFSQPFLEKIKLYLHNLRPCRRYLSPRINHFLRQTFINDIRPLLFLHQTSQCLVFFKTK